MRVLPWNKKWILLKWIIWSICSSMAICNSTTQTLPFVSLQRKHTRYLVSCIKKSHQPMTMDHLHQLERKALRAHFVPQKWLPLRRRCVSCISQNSLDLDIIFLPWAWTTSIQSDRVNEPLHYRILIAVNTNRMRYFSSTSNVPTDYRQECWCWLSADNWNWKHFTLSSSSSSHINTCEHMPRGFIQTRRGHKGEWLASERIYGYPGYLGPR